MSFKKCNLLNKENQQRVEILYSGTILYVVHAICKRKNLVPLVIKKYDFYKSHTIF